jgi:SAM-dependent methyltransferase
MSWVEEFSTRQFAWLRGERSSKISASDQDRAERIASAAGPPPSRVLELGAGGGETAAATADLGYEVIAVELAPAIAAAARRFAEPPRSGTLEVIEENFHEIDLAGAFDVVAYWDGFGVDDDAGLRALLCRIHDWLRPDVQALIEVYTPWYWAEAAGTEMEIGHARRQYGFDAAGCRMTDRWWQRDDPSNAVEQSLRCYSPADLALLLEGTGLALTAVEPGGAVDRATGAYHPGAPLTRAMSYLAICTRRR